MKEKLFLALSAIRATSHSSPWCFSLRVFHLNSFQLRKHTRKSSRLALGRSESQLERCERWKTFSLKIILEKFPFSVLIFSRFEHSRALVSFIRKFYHFSLLVEGRVEWSTWSEKWMRFSCFFIISRLHFGFFLLALLLLLAFNPPRAMLKKNCLKNFNEWKFNLRCLATLVEIETGDYIRHCGALWLDSACCNAQTTIISET